MVTEEIRNNLPWYQNDYTKDQGTPFEHFFCPLMMRDEPVELCMGHIIPDCIPDSSRFRVVQRKDIDGFYGRVAEADFGALMAAKQKGLKGILRDRGLQRKIRPTLLIGDKTTDYFSYQGKIGPNQTRLSLQTKEDPDPVELVIKVPPEEAIAAQTRQWSFGFEFDCTVTALVTLIKAAYLTLFRIHGYRWALSSSGTSIGYYLLGDFFRENQSKNPEEIKEALKTTFLKYRHMVRPVAAFTGDSIRDGTLNDHQTGICYGSSGKEFAEIVHIRAGTQFYGVLMPAFETANSAAAFWDFLNNDNETLRVNRARFDLEKNQVHIEKDPMEVCWPKDDEIIELESPVGHGVPLVTNAASHVN
jgi:hypothetical protein